MKYRVLRELPTYNVGDIFELKDQKCVYRDITRSFPINVWTEDLIQQGWIEEVKEEV